MDTLQLKKSLLSTPGERIQEHIDFTGMSQAELAERLGRSVPKLNELIKGKAPITKETASKLEFVLGVPASFWLNLEKIYQEELLQIEQLEFLETCKSWVSGFPIVALKNEFATFYK
ncbi:MAG: helix-turn-helix domain-containing protein [Saprospiraceae bacterium]|nr:helix-turn-helix domain-containing protein [Saprospiraceae bacterium]